MTDSTSHPQENINLAIVLTFAAGFATTIGASLSFCVSPRFTQILPISLAFSAGVMIYISFVEILSEALESFEQELTISHTDSVDVLSHIYVSISLFGGIVIGFILDYIVHSLGHDHDHQNKKQLANNEQKEHVIPFTDTELSESETATAT
eukprot:UN09233